MKLRSNLANCFVYRTLTGGIFDIEIELNEKYPHEVYFDLYFREHASSTEEEKAFYEHHECYKATFNDITRHGIR